MRGSGPSRLYAPRDALVTPVCSPLDDAPARPHTMSSFFGLSKTRTFKPKRNIPEGTKQ